jgi:peptidoglycan/xylan/chitin deacetylase (PgdA/CDA1 family)
MKKIPFFLLSAIFISLSFTAMRNENNHIYIATYKNDMIGAYSLIHDDYGAAYADGIEKYADTMAFNRGIPFSFAVIAGECNEQDWKNAEGMIAHGHQVLNHSMNHKCGKENEWCHFGNWNEKHFDVEIDSSTSYIQKYTGKHPAFFIFPFDLFTDTMVSYLQHRKYAGARAGLQNILQEPHITDPFKLNFNVFRPEQNTSVLNSFADEAIEKKSWAIRVVHGVNDQSWASLNLQEYEKHLEYLKKLSKENKLWVATLSDIAYYSMLREKYELKIAETDKKGRVKKIIFSERKIMNSNNQDEFFIQAQKTSNAKELTIVVLYGFNISEIIQDGRKVTFNTRDGKTIFNTDPAAGPVIINYKK